MGNGGEERTSDGTIKRFESCPAGVRLIYTKNDTQDHIDTTVAAAGWAANTAGLDLATAGVGDDQRGHARVDSAASHHRATIFAAGDITGHIIDGRPTGFCKLVVDRELHTILGCYIVGERAVELVHWGPSPWPRG